MAALPVIKLAKPKNERDFVIVNRDDNEKQIAIYKKQGFTKEIAIDGNELRPGAEEPPGEVETEAEEAAPPPAKRSRRAKAEETAPSADEPK